MRLRRMQVAVVSSALALTSIFALPAGAANAADGTGPTTFDQFSALPYDQQAAVLAPLRAVAGALDELGRGSRAADYGDVVIDPVARTAERTSTCPIGLNAIAKGYIVGVAADASGSSFLKKAGGGTRPVYRISVRVTGPRNTQAYLQNTVTL